MHSFKFYFIFILGFALGLISVKAQPDQFDFISANETDTIWVSRTDQNNHTSDYNLYYWWNFKHHAYSREYYQFAAFVKQNELNFSSGNVGNRLSVLSTPVRVPFSPVFDSASIFISEHGYDRWWLFGWHYNHQFTIPRLILQIDTIIYSTLLPPKNLKVIDEGEVDYKVDLTWEKGTDLPDAEHQYIILRDGIPVDTVDGNVSSFRDEPNPGVYLYEVKTFWEGSDTCLMSVSDSVVGKTYLLNLDYTTHDNKVLFSWNALDTTQGREGANVEYYKLLRCDTADKENSLREFDKINNVDHQFVDEEQKIPGYKYQYVLRPYPYDKFYPDTIYAGIPADGGFTGKVESLTGLGVPGVTVYAYRLDTVPQDTTSVYYATTDQRGEFTLENVYYHIGSDFTLLPRFKDHGFKLLTNPMYPENKFRLENGGIGGITFVDTSTFVVQGEILQPGFRDSCYLYPEGIKVKLYMGSKLVDESFTDETGLYSFNIDSGGIYSFVPEFFEHRFSPDSFSYAIYCDTLLEVIADTTQHLLSGFARGACNTYFGQASIQIKDKGGCVDTIISTDENGYYEIELPANTYNISLVAFQSTDNTIENDAVVSYFTSEEVDVAPESLNYHFIYRSPPLIEISGLNSYACGDMEGIPIVKQDYSYPIVVSVRDVFTDKACLADTGYVRIQDYTGYSDFDTTIAIQNGKVLYRLQPGYPNTIQPHTKDLNISAYLGKETTTHQMEVFVEGAKPLENSFVTTSPEIPLFILHDPPGDHSYSYLQKDSTSNIAISNISHEVRNKDGYSNEWKVCPQSSISYGGLFWSVGFNVEAGWRRIRSVNEDEIINKTEESVFEMTHKQGYQTSSAPELTSSTGGDVFIGGAMNLIYAETQEIYYDYQNCQATTSWDIFMFPHSLATDFVYSENHIQHYLIPELERLQRYYESLEDDTATYFEDQKNIWLTALANNKQNLADSSSFIKRVSFDGGAGPISEETSESAKNRISYEFHSTFDTTVMRYWKADVAGVGYERSKVKSKVRIETGMDSSYNTTNVTTTGYVLKDDDSGDKYMVEVYRDNVYGTPAFKLVSGNTSCPYENGTRPREGVQLRANKYVAIVADPDGQAVFRLQLANTSQTSETQDYNLFFHQGSNPDGARLTLGGSEIQAGIPTPYSLPAWGATETTVTVKRGPEAFDYNNLMFTLESDCDDEQIVDTLLLDVHFKSLCSKFFINKPLENWVVTSANDGKLKATVAGYDRDLLDDITLQICPEGQYDSWYSLEYLTAGQLKPEQTDVNLFLSELEDGVYEIRARLECSSGKIYTQPIKGTIDSHGPSSYGAPEPSDDVLNNGDEISALFDETINPLAFSNANVTFKNTSTHTVLACQAGVVGDKVTIYPVFPAVIDSTDVFRAFIYGLKDVHGNEMKDTLTWAFTVLNKLKILDKEDADKDSIWNKNDNCPYMANTSQSDLDMDGLGDACDPDIDGDGISNFEDNCPFASNQEQADLDEDGLGDFCDNDDDGDMIADSIDNKPRIFNPDQEVGVQRIYSGFAVTIQPNPVSDVLNVNSTYLVSEIKIYDAIGRLVYIESVKNRRVFDINVSDFYSGLFVLECLDKDGNTLVHKFIKE